MKKKLILIGFVLITFSTIVIDALADVTTCIEGQSPQNNKKRCEIGIYPNLHCRDVGTDCAGSTVLQDFEP